MRINVLGIVFGIAAGFLAAALIAVTTWGIQLLFVSGSEPTGAIIVGAIVGAGVAGFVTGKVSIAKLFNGAAAGVLYAGAITLLSVLDGSPAPAGTIILFVVTGLLLGAIGGYVAHRRNPPPPVHSP